MAPRTALRGNPSGAAASIAVFALAVVRGDASVCFDSASLLDEPGAGDGGTPLPRASDAAEDGCGPGRVFRVPSLRGAAVGDLGNAPAVVGGAAVGGAGATAGGAAGELGFAGGADGAGGCAGGAGAGGAGAGGGAGGAGGGAGGAGAGTLAPYFAKFCTAHVVPPEVMKEIPISVKSPRIFERCPDEFIHPLCTADGEP